MVLNALEDSFLPQSEKSMGLKGLKTRTEQQWNNTDRPINNIQKAPESCEFLPEMCTVNKTQKSIISTHLHTRRHVYHVAIG